MTKLRIWKLPKRRSRPGQSSESHGSSPNEATCEKDDARSRGPGLTEGLPNSPLGLSDELVQELTWKKLVRRKTGRKRLLTSGPLTATKLIADSAAQALTRSVLLHPGGPYNKTPLGAPAPNRAKASGCFSGHSITSFNFCIT